MNASFILICFDEGGEPIFHLGGDSDRETEALQNWLEEIFTGGCPLDREREPIPPDPPIISGIGGEDEQGYQVGSVVFYSSEEKETISSAGSSGSAVANRPMAC